MPRSATRNFPDVAQNGIGTGVVLNKSRVTFSGQKGTVILFYLVDYINNSGVAISRISTVANSNFTPLRVFSGESWSDLTAGRHCGTMLVVVVQDPPNGGFVEAHTDLSGANVDLPIGGGAFMALSFPQDDQEGPVVSVA